VVYHKAFGHLQLVPEKLPMKPDTVFDMASLTKPIATATSVMTLVECGQVDLRAPVAKYIPEFGVNGKEHITVRQLLIHSGGLIPDNEIEDYANGPTEAFRKIYALGTYVEPGTEFVYTDVGFIVLAEMVHRITGKNIHEYSQDRIFRPLRMTETGYLPAESLRARAAVTQERDGQPMRGEVHDPRAWAMGGVSGHAGLFSTATDLAKYAQMMINGGSWGDARVLKPETVQLMRSPVQVSSGLRTLGWDMRSPYSSNRGDFFSKAAFGHGGFTGTTLWIDPEQDLFVIFLSNRVHPDGKGSVNALAGRIGTIASGAISIELPNTRE
jgi:CubicO group peptidase (beta-lactamase class C family)